ncbi:MAG: hypothetical protein H0T58_13190 [Gemmatimonadales bacterium]|nr:hypothetical protein [Gemmatimonadales bacterium]
MLQILIALAAGLLGFAFARNFVRRRLRFVDAIHSPVAPLLAGLAGAAATWPAAFLPFITLMTIVAFGIGTGLGTASGSRALRDSAAAPRRLIP